jgi:hypothetical protein
MACGLFVWLVADVWCWFVLREKYCWLVAGGWFVVRETAGWRLISQGNMAMYVNHSLLGHPKQKPKHDALRPVRCLLQQTGCAAAEVPRSDHPRQARSGTGTSFTTSVHHAKKVRAFLLFLLFTGLGSPPSSTVATSTGQIWIVFCGLVGAGFRLSFFLYTCRSICLGKHSKRFHFFKKTRRSQFCKLHNCTCL